MTPDQARRLLDGTTPGPWKWCEGKDQNGEFVALSGPAGADALRTWDGDLYASGVHGTNADKALVAAAPALAAMVAGMREEWGVLYESHFGGLVARHEQWKDSDGKFDRDAAHRYAARCERSGHENVRVVRRYVTTPEEA